MRFLFAILTAFTLAAKAQDTSVVLDGSKSQGVKFNWEQIKGEKAEMVDADSMKCLVKGLTQGIYAFRLTAISDCCKSIDSSTVRVVMDKTMGITEDSAVKAAAKEKFTTAEIKAWQDGDIILQVNSPRYEELTIRLSDVAGRVLFEKQVTVNEGVNKFSIPPPLSGIYIVTVQGYFYFKAVKIAIF